MKIWSNKSSQEDRLSPNSEEYAQILERFNNASIQHESLSIEEKV